MTEIITAIVFSLVVPKETLRFTSVYEQHTDASCGLAATASLLSIYRGEQVLEDQLAIDLASYRKELVFDQESLDLIAPDRITLADLKQLIDNRGVPAKGFRMNLDELSEAVSKLPPVLVHYQYPTPHFALTLRVHKSWVITADPATGVELQPVEAFSKRWSGAVLVAATTSYEGWKEKVNGVVDRALHRLRSLERWAW